MRGKNIIIVTVVIGLLLVFSTVWSVTHSSSDENGAPTETTTATPEPTPETTAASTEESSAEVTPTPEANVSSQPDANAQVIDDLNQQIDNLNQQIADKDSAIAELQSQLDTQNQNSEDGFSFQDFLNLYFWSDGNVYRMSSGQLYTEYTCAIETEISSEGITFVSNRVLEVKRDNSLTVKMLYTTDGRILWSPNPFLEKVPVEQG